MFELIMFWFWVSVSTYVLILPIWLLFFLLLGGYAKSILTKTTLSKKSKSIFLQHLEDTKYYPVKWIPADNWLMSMAISLVGIGMSTAMVVAMANDATLVDLDLPAAIVRVVSVISSTMAEYTSWLVLPLALIVGFHTIASKTITRIINIVTKLDRIP